MILVLVSFALTILAFVVSRAITELQSRRIEQEAATVGRNALVAAEALIDERTEIRKLLFQMDALRASAQPDIATHVSGALEHSRQAATESWNKYVSLPFFPGEAELVASVEPDLAELQRVVAEIVARLHDGDREGALRVIDLLALPTLARADDGVHDLLMFNQRKAQQGTVRIVQQVHSRMLWLDVAGACFAIAAAVFGVRVLRRYLAVSAERSAELERFAGRVAHDVRSPLGSISLSLEIAQKSEAVTPDIRLLLTRATRTLQRVGELVDGLLVFATTGGYIVEQAGERQADVRDVLDGVIEDLQLDADKKQIQLDYEKPSPALRVACTPGVLISIATNLVCNAMKFMGDAKVRRIGIRAREVGGNIRFDVCDTGPGVAPELRERIFKPFARGESPAAGFGLGLATVRKLVEAHGGMVGLEETPTGGCCFYFYLPIARAEHASRPQPRPLGYAS